MDARKVASGHGWMWLRQGFGLFRKSPLMWIVLLMVYILIIIGASIIPLIGQLLVTLFAPAFVVGFMLAAQAADRDEELELSQLFGGFKTHLSNLVTVGGIYLIGNIVIIFSILMLGGGSAMLGAMMQGADPESIPAAAASGMAVALLLGLALLLPLIMAYWFAPALVAFDGMKPVDAMKLSFHACLKNLAPFTVYGIIAFVLTTLAMIPFGLGLLIMVPTLTATIYTSYRDIFPEGMGQTSSGE